MTASYKAPDLSNQEVTPQLVRDELLTCFESANREFARVMNQPFTDEALRQQVKQFVVTIFSQCGASYADPTAPWGGVKRSGIGRTHGLVGLREMVQVKYVSLDTGKSPLLWWYPYGPEFHRVMSVSNRALHASSAWTRIRNALGLLGLRRFRRRVRLKDLLRNVDKLF